MPRPRKSLFADCETKEQLAAVLQNTSGLSIADIQAAKMILQLRGWSSDAEPSANVESQGDVEIVPTNTSANKLSYTEDDLLRAEAVSYVSVVRQRHGGKVVSLDEVLASPYDLREWNEDRIREKWSTPERRAALETVLGWQK